MAEHDREMSAADISCRPIRAIAEIACRLPYQARLSNPPLLSTYSVKTVVQAAQMTARRPPICPPFS